MKIKIVVPFLMTVILSACASDQGAKNADSKPHDEAEYVTGSNIPRHTSGAPMEPVTTENAANFKMPTLLKVKGSQ
jgi:hypothetical protein